MTDIAPLALPRPRGLADPLLRLNLAGFLLSITIYSPILVLFYTGRGLSLFQVLSLEAFTGLAIVLFEIPTGVVADRIGLKRATVLGFALQAVWVVVLMLSPGYLFFLAGYALLGMAIAFRSGATEAWIFETLKARGEPERMARAQGAFWAAQLTGRIASAALAVLVVPALTEGYFLLALGLSAAAMAAGTLLVLTVPNRHTATPAAAAASSLRLVGDAVRLLRGDAPLRRIALLSVFGDPMPYVLLFLYQPYFREAGTPTAFYGLAAAGGAALGALGARLSHRLEARFGGWRSLLLATVLPAAGYALMALVVEPYVAVLLYVVTFGTMQIRYPLVAALRNRRIASANRATAISLLSMLEGGWALAIKLTAGYLADIDLALAFALLTAVPLVSVIALRGSAIGNQQ